MSNILARHLFPNYPISPHTLFSKRHPPIRKIWSDINIDRVFFFFLITWSIFSCFSRDDGSFYCQFGKCENDGTRTVSCICSSMNKKTKFFVRIFQRIRVYYNYNQNTMSQYNNTRLSSTGTVV